MSLIVLKVSYKKIECNVWWNIETKIILGESLKKANEIDKISRTLYKSNLTKFCKMRYINSRFSMPQYWLYNAEIFQTSMIIRKLQLKIKNNLYQNEHLEC